MRFSIIAFFILDSVVGFSQKRNTSVITVNDKDSLTYSKLNSLAEGTELFFVFVFDNDNYWECRMKLLDSLKMNERYNIGYQGVKLLRSKEGRKNQFILGEVAEPNTFFVYSKHRAVTITMDHVFTPFKNYSNWYTIDLGVCENNECLKFEKNVVGKVDQLKRRYKEIFDAIEINGLVASCLTRMDSLENQVGSLKMQLDRKPELLLGLTIGQGFMIKDYPFASDFISGSSKVEISRRPEFGMELISLRNSPWERIRIYLSGGISRSRSDIKFTGDSLLFVVQDPSLDSNLTRYRNKSINESYYLKSLNLPISVGGYASIGSNAHLLFGLGLRFSKSYSGGFSDYGYQENNFISIENSDLILENIPSLGLNSYSSYRPSYSFAQTSWYSYLVNLQYLRMMSKYFYAISINYERNASFSGEKSLSSNSIDDSENYFTPDFESRIKQNIAVQLKFGINFN